MINSVERKVTDVVYVPNLSLNLLSVSQMVNKGLAVVFSKDGCDIYKQENCTVSGHPVAHATNVDGLYKLDTDPKNKMSSNFVGQSKDSNTEELWHRRLAHLNRKSMNLLRDKMSTGMSYSGQGPPCVSCIQGKQTTTPYSKKKTGCRATGLLELVHSDLCGPMNVSSYGGARYLLTLIY